MEKRTSKTAVLGKQINRPSEALDLIEWSGGDVAITLSTKEFTSHCPVTGAPDFGAISVEYVPAQRIVETKSFKLWMWSFRSRKSFNEKLVDEISRKFMEKVKPKRVKVRGIFAPRGGVQVICESERRCRCGS